MTPMAPMLSAIAPTASQFMASPPTNCESMALAAVSSGKVFDVKPAFQAIALGGRWIAEVRLFCEQHGTERRAW
jgi:hypothetical protein